MVPLLDYMLLSSIHFLVVLKDYTATSLISISNCTHFQSQEAEHNTNIKKCVIQAVILSHHMWDERIIKQLRVDVDPKWACSRSGRSAVGCFLSNIHPNLAFKVVT